MKWKQGFKKSIAPGKFKGVKATSIAVGVVWSMPKQLLFGKGKSKVKK